MKLLNFILIHCLALAVMASTPAFAQQASTPAQSVASPQEPMKMVDDFFSKLEAGRVDSAYDEILKGTKIAESPKDVTLLKTKTREAIKVFGDMMGHDVAATKMIGSRLLRVTCVSLGKLYPIRWRLYFYKAVDSWKLIDVRIDDRLLDMFDDSATAPSAAQ